MKNNFSRRPVARLFAFALVAFPAVSAFAAKPISFSADRMSGASGKRDEFTVLEGSATVTTGALSISGDRIELTGKDYRYVRAVGNVRGNDSENGYTLSSGELTYDRETEIAEFRGDARLSDTKHGVEASAVSITYNQKTEVALLRVSVRLKKNKIDCTSGFALYRRSLSALELTGSPFVTRDGDVFRADRISVDLDTERITLDGTVSGTLKRDDEKKKNDAPDRPNAPKAEGGSEAGGTPPSDGPIGGKP